MRNKSYGLFDGLSFVVPGIAFLVFCGLVFWSAFGQSDTDCDDGNIAIYALNNWGQSCETPATRAESAADATETQVAGGRVAAPAYQPAPSAPQPAAQQQVEAAPVEAAPASSDQRVPLKPYRVPAGAPPPPPNTSCVGQSDGGQQCWRND